MVLFFSFEAMSCDVCGAAVGPGTMGLLPNNQYHFVGIRNRFSKYHSFHKLVLSNDHLRSSQHFFQSSIEGRWQAFNDLDFYGTIPYVYNWQNFNGTTIQEQGIGDLSLQSNYRIINKKDSILGHQLRIGIGVKLPTGNYSRTALKTSNLFPGTGSVDGIFSSAYVFSKATWGILQENTFILKSTNLVKYKYGNSFSTMSAVFLKRKKGENTVFIPHLGINYLWSGTDQIDGINISQQSNGGHLISLEAGIRIMYQKWMLSARYNQSILQRLSDGLVENRIGNTALTITYLIQKK